MARPVTRARDEQVLQMVGLRLAGLSWRQVALRAGAPSPQAAREAVAPVLYAMELDR